MAGSYATVKADWDCSTPSLFSCSCQPNCPTNASVVEVKSVAGAYNRPSVTSQCAFSGQTYTCIAGFTLPSDNQLGGVSWRWTLGVGAVVTNVILNSGSNLGSFFFFPPLPTPTIRIASNHFATNQVVTQGFSAVLNVTVPYPGILPPTVTLWGRPALTYLSASSIATTHIFTLPFNSSSDYLGGVLFTVSNIADGIHAPLSTVFTTTSDGSWAVGDVGLQAPGPNTTDTLEVMPEKSYLVFSNVTVQPPPWNGWADRWVQSAVVSVTVPNPAFVLSLNANFPGLITTYDVGSNKLTIWGWGSQSTYSNAIRSIVFRNNDRGAPFDPPTYITLTVFDNWNTPSPLLSRRVGRFANLFVADITIEPGAYVRVLEHIPQNTLMETCTVSLSPVYDFDTLSVDVGLSQSVASYDSVNKVMYITFAGIGNYEAIDRHSPLFATVFYVRKGIHLTETTTRWATTSCIAFGGDLSQLPFYYYQRIIVKPSAPRTIITPGASGFLVSRNLFWKLGLCCYTSDPSQRCQVCISDGRIVSQYLVESTIGGDNQGQVPATPFFFNTTVSLSTAYFTTINGQMRGVQGISFAQQLHENNWDSSYTNYLTGSSPWTGRSFNGETTLVTSGLYIDDAGTLRALESHTGKGFAMNESPPRTVSGPNYLFDIGPVGRVLTVKNNAEYNIAPVSFFQGNYQYHQSNSSATNPKEILDSIYNQGDTPLLYKRTLIQTTTVRSEYASASSNSNTYALGMKVGFSEEFGGYKMSAEVSADYSLSKSSTQQSTTASESSNSTAVTLSVSIPPQTTMRLSKDVRFENLMYSSDNVLSYCFPTWGFCKYIDQKVAPDVGVQRSFVQFHFTMIPGGAT